MTKLVSPEREALMNEPRNNQIPHPKAGKHRLNEIDTTKSSLLLKEKSQDALFLSFVLSSMSDRNGHSGRASPKLARLKKIVPFPERLNEVIDELEAGGHWSVQRDPDSGEATGFYPLFLDDDELIARAKTYFPGIAQLKYLRYAGYPTSGSRLIVAWLMMNFRQNFTDLGYKADANAGREPSHQIWFHKDGKLKAAKLCHGTHFNHPLLRMRTPEAYQKLASLTELPDDMLTQPLSKKMRISDFRAVGFSTWEHFQDCLLDLVASGEWTYQIHRSPLPTNLFEHFEREIVFTPTAKWHRAIWNRDFLAGGTTQNDWEIANHFYPIVKERGDNLRQKMPLLGMNTHYLLLHAETLAPFWSGETRKPANERLEGHLLKPTSLKMEDALHEYIRGSEQVLIVPTSQIHHDYIAEFEMFTIEVFEAHGYKFMNTIRDVERNRRTITLDPELLELSPHRRQEFLNTVFATHGIIKAEDLSAYPEVERIMKMVIAEFMELVSSRRGGGNVAMVA